MEEQGDNAEVSDLMEQFVCVDVETTGLHAFFGDEITCICAKDSEGHIFQMTTEGQKEADLILDFTDWLNRYKDKGYTLITFNGRSFDIPFILARACMSNLLTVRTFHHPFVEFKHLDLIECNYKRLSLRDLAEIYGCPIQKSGTGENAILLAKERRFQELVASCMNDVDTTIAVYQALKAHGRVPQQEQEVTA